MYHIIISCIIESNHDMVFEKPNGNLAIYDWKRKSREYESKQCTMYVSIRTSSCDFLYNL